MNVFCVISYKSTYVRLRTQRLKNNKNAHVAKLNIITICRNMGARFKQTSIVLTRWVSSNDTVSTFSTYLSPRLVLFKTNLS